MVNRTTTPQDALKAAQERHQALQAERDGLERALDALRADLSAQEAALPALQAGAERSGSQKAIRARDKAESERDKTARRIERKQSALESVTADIAAAKADLESAQRDVWQAEYDDLADQARDVCARLDTSPFDRAAYAHLRELWTQHRVLLRKLAGPGAIPGTFERWRDPHDTLRIMIRNQIGILTQGTTRGDAGGFLGAIGLFNRYTNAGYAATTWAAAMNIDG